MESIYLKQNPDFQTNKVITNFLEIANILGIHPNSSKQIWKSLSKLNDVKIKAELRVKNGQRLFDINSEFHLLASVTRIFTRNVRGKKRKTETLEIELNRWHIDNFKNRYYRVVNLWLVTQLRSGIAVRFFDYLNYKTFYYDIKAKKYRQKLKIRIAYKNLVKYLHILERPNLTEIKRQFRTAFNELISNGVLRKIEYEKTPVGIFFTLYLARSINWKEVEPQEELLLVGPRKRKTALEQKLEQFNLSDNQIDKIIASYPSEHIKQKIDQTMFMLKFAPNKVKGRGSYLYQSIVNNWKSDMYEEHLASRRKAEKDIEKTKVKKFEKEYDQYVLDTCEHYYNVLPQAEKDLIGEEVEERLKAFKEKVKGTRALMYEAYMFEIIRKRAEIMEFKEFCEMRKMRTNPD